MKEQLRNPMNIAVITGVAYFYTFLYEYFALKYFDVPLQFLEISIPKILFVTFILVVILLILIFIIESIYALFPKWLESPFGRSTFFSVFYTIFAFSIKSYAGVSTPWYHYLVFIGVVYGDHIDALIRYRKGVSYFQLYEAQIARRGRSLTSELDEKYNLGLNGILALVIILGLTVGSLGRGSSMLQTKFMMLSDDPTMVVLKATNSSMYCAKVDTVSRQIENQYSILNYVSHGEINIHYQSIGPLLPR